MQGSGASGMGGATGFEEATRQIWSAWGDMMRGAGAPAAVPPWNDPAAWWAQMGRAARPEPPNPAEALLHRFREQAGGWFGQMQQLASQFAGRNASATEIAAAWKQALGGNAAGAFTDVFATMSRPGQQGMETWIAQMRPILGFVQSMQGGQPDARAWMGLPAFGFAREHQERWQQLALAQVEHQDRSRDFAELMADAAQRAFVKFEEKLAARSEPGKQIESTRALFDLWIDAAEDAYAEIALSERFREAYGALVDAQMRLRAAVQREVEQFGQLLGTPTRTEVDSAHRKIVQLERELRRMRDAITALQDRQGAQAGHEVPTAAPPTGRAAAMNGSAAPGGVGATAPASIPKRAAGKRESTGRTAPKPARTKPAAAQPRTAERGRKAAAPAKQSRKPRR
jgi:class III poly(R)-hydroxyalkanoic acid synthase PhaE subunit